MCLRGLHKENYPTDFHKDSYPKRSTRFNSSWGKPLLIAQGFLFLTLCLLY